MDSVRGENIVEKRIENILAEQSDDIRRESTLPFEEKIRILIRMQARAAGMRPDRDWTVWSIPEELFPRSTQEETR